MFFLTEPSSQPLLKHSLIVSELAQFYCDINTTSKSIVYNLYNFEKIKSMFFSAALIKYHQLGDLQKKKFPTQFWRRLGNPRLRFLCLRFLEMTHLSKATPSGDSFTKALGPFIIVMSLWTGQFSKTLVSNTTNSRVKAQTNLESIQGFGNHTSDPYKCILLIN